MTKDDKSFIYINMTVLMRIFFVFSILIFPTIASADVEKLNWNKILLQDAKFIRDTLAENHPGYYDLRNPKFKDQVEGGYKALIQEAKGKNDYGSYRWLLRKYVAGFNDGHLSIAFKSNEKIVPQWAGIITKFHGSNQIVDFSDSSKSNLPPVGAQLISCDGQDANKFAFSRQGQFRSAWFSQAVKELFGEDVLVNWGNPLIKNPKACIFKVGSAIKTYRLSFQEIEKDTLTKIQAGLNSTQSEEFKFSQIENGYWASFPSFSANDETSSKKINDVIEQIEKNEVEIKKSKFFVLDLRGNGGGASMYPIKIAQILWNDAVVLDAMPINGKQVLWRASKGNIEYLRRDDSIYSTQIPDGVQKSLKKGEPFFVQNPWRSIDAKRPSKPISLPIFVLTDIYCFSTCLMAVDTFKFLGAIQIGEETGADTNYMDIRDAKLPSGMGTITFSMNMFKGRKRGINETQKPDIKIQDPHNDGEVLKAIREELENQINSPM